MDSHGEYTDDTSEDGGFVEDKFGRCYYTKQDGFYPAIYGLYVKEWCRGKGHATRLLRYIIDEIRREGYVGRIDIDATPKDETVSKQCLVEFYERNGLNVINKNRSCELECAKGCGL